MKTPSSLQSAPVSSKIDMDLLTRSILVAAFMLLPFSHFRWLPNLGTTRPISSVLFVLALGLILLTESIRSIRGDGFRRQNLFGLNFIFTHLPTLPGWRILLPWVVLIGLGIVSAAFTTMYGNFFQALNRLLGYGIIFATLYCGLYASKIFSIQKLATWVSLGYLPVLAYGIIEAAATQKAAWAIPVVNFVRSWIVVEFNWAGRIAYFSTEPSFVGFQLLLLIALMPFLQSRALRLTNIIIILVALIFSKSGNVLVQVAVYFAFLVFFQLKAPIRAWLFAISAAIVSAAAIWFVFFPPFHIDHYKIYNLSVILKTPRLYSIAISSMIRGSHMQNLVHALIETRGLGLGIGQYGFFWKEIYLRHFNPQLADPSGEIAQTLASGEYGRPWSVIFGVGVDLGITGLLILLGFFYLIWQSVKTPHSRAILIASLVALIGAYPIVTPHIWLALALVVGLAAAGEQEPSAA